MAKIINYIEGMNVGSKCVLVKIINPTKRNRTRGLVRCECGNEFEAILTSVRIRNSGCQACGHIIANAKQSIHGESNRAKKVKEYLAWRCIKNRCYNENNVDYRSYGGRGISMSEAWIDSYQTFLADIGRAPSPKHSIDRINVNGNYTKENVRWATPIQQARNKRTNLVVDYKGQKITIAELAEKEDIRYSILWKRIYISKMSIADAISKPIFFFKKTLLDTQTGIFYESLNEAARIFSISPATLRRYISNQRPNTTSLISV